MTISTAIRLPAERNPLLFQAGLVSMAGFVICFAVSLFDGRMVEGVNTWIKPMKFYASFTIFLWTFALILHHLPDTGKTKWISRILVLCMIMEAIPITLQAARGVPSHYNDDTLFDLILFQIMGMFILINTAVAVYVLILFFGRTRYLTEPVKRSVQTGLFIFIAGAVSGGMMVAMGNHLVGSGESTEALPFLTWSRTKGDLRAAHFFTLHALQIIPLVTLLFRNSILQNKSAVTLWSGAYALFCVYLHQRALAGEAFF